MLRGDILFTEKASNEMERDDLDEELVCEAVINAPAIAKRIRSTNPKTGRPGYLYIIIGVTYDGLVIYTKGKILQKGNRQVFYVFISSKKSTS